MKKVKTRLPWSIYNDEYLVSALIRQIKRKKVSRELVNELVKRGIFEEVLEVLENDKEFAKSYREAIEFIKNVVVSLYVKEALGKKWRVPETFAKYPEIISDWLREEYSEVIDKFEDEKFIYEVRFENGELRIVPMWKL